MNKATATALIARYAKSTDATIRGLVTDARHMLRIGNYDAVGRLLSDDTIARQRNLY